MVILVVYKDKIIFSIPAGKRDLGETAWECAVRETAEEAGLDIGSAAYQGVTQPAINAIFQPTPDARYPEVDNAVIVRSHSICNASTRSAAISDDDLKHEISPTKWFQEYHIRMDPTGGMQTFIVSLKSIGTDEDEDVDDIISGVGSMKV